MTVGNFETEEDTLEELKTHIEMFREPCVKVRETVPGAEVLDGAIVGLKTLDCAVSDRAQIGAHGRDADLGSFLDLADVESGWQTRESEHSSKERGIPSEQSEKFHLGARRTGSIVPSEIESFHRGGEVKQIWIRFEAKYR